MKLNLKRPLAFFDLETTGTDVGTDRIVEIGILKVNTDNSIKNKVQRINPGIPIPVEASLIHGIYDEDVKDSPAFKQVAKELAAFLEGCDLGGYNSNRFDIPILIEEFLRADVNFKLNDRKLIDVQRIFHQMERRDLSAAYKFYCNKTLENAHTAEADATAAYEILLSQLERYSDQLQNDINFLHDFTNDGDLVDTARRMVFDKNGKEVFNFGKFKGRSVEDVLKVEPQYYDWMMKSDFPLHTKQKLTEIKLRQRQS